MGQEIWRSHCYLMMFLSWWLSNPGNDGPLESLWNLFPDLSPHTELSSLPVFFFNTRYLLRRKQPERERKGGRDGGRKRRGRGRGSSICGQEHYGEYLKGVVSSTIFQPISVLLCFPCVFCCDMIFKFKGILFLLEGNSLQIEEGWSAKKQQPLPVTVERQTRRIKIQKCQNLLNRGFRWDFNSVQFFPCLLTLDSPYKPV